MIITDEKILRTPCEDVLPEEIGHLRDALEVALKYSEEMGRPGIGIACPQIGIFKKFSIVRIPGSNGVIKLDLINPIIEVGYDLAPFEGEGCLSFPGVVKNTMRYSELVVKNQLVEPQRFIVKGLLFATCTAHEIEHLDGKLLIDKP